MTKKFETRAGKKPVHPKPSGPKQVSNAGKRVDSKNRNQSLPLTEKIDKFLNLNMNRVFWISFGITILMGLLLFDIRVSLSGDDASYIIRADDFFQNFYFPGFQGPLYPIFLSPFVGIFGIRVIILKFISLLLMLGFIWFTYKAFYRRIPLMLLTAILFLTSVNSCILFYASQTYSEALFMFLQALTFLVFFTYFIDADKETSPVSIKRHFILASCVLALVLTRSIGLAAIFAISGYFIVKLQWKNLIRFIGSFALLMIVFELVKYLIWNYSGVTSTLQVQSLMAKDYYNPAMGKENLMGIIHRFFENSNQYISNYFYTIIGLNKPEDIFAHFPVVTVITYILLSGSVIIAFRKNNYLFFTGIYVLVFLVITFLIVNTYWGQDRFIIPYISLILLVLLAFFYFILELKPFTSFKALFPVFVSVLFLMTLYSAVEPIIAARQITNRYSNLTPDWKNYCRISEWASQNLPDEALVACRKPSISFIYGRGRHFYGIMNVPSYPGDSILLNWQKKQLHYSLITASSLKNGPVSKDLYYTFKKNVVGYGIDNELGVHNIKFYIMNFPDSVKSPTFAELNKSKIEVTSDFEDLKLMLNNPALKISIIYPDSLVKMLYKAKVTHVLTANLRNYATVERMMSYIEFKYPDIKSKIMQVGSDESDAAYIYKLNYDQCGLSH